MVTVSTSVAGDVREHHFKCSADHEFSVLTKSSLDVAPSLPLCIVDGCSGWSKQVGDNAAEVSSNPVDFLRN